MTPLLLASGCADRVELPEVPVIGGTAPARELVDAELAAFDGATGPGRVVVSEVVFTDIGPDRLGTWNPRTGRIRLSVDVPVDRVREVLRHELCHALDTEEGLLDAPVAPFDTFAELFRGSTPRRRRGEALAWACELGWRRAAALDNPCPNDTPLVTAVYGWAAQNVWTAVPNDAVPHDDVVPFGSWTAPASWDDLQLLGTEDPDVLEIRLDGWSTHVDLDGREVDDHPDAVRAPRTPPGDVPFGYGWPDGPGVSLMAFPLSSLVGHAERRLTVWVDGVWTPIPGTCLDHDVAYEVFVVGDRLWIGWGDGRTVAWMPIAD